MKNSIIIIQLILLIALSLYLSDACTSDSLTNQEDWKNGMNSFALAIEGTPSGFNSMGDLSTIQLGFSNKNNEDLLAEIAIYGEYKDSENPNKLTKGIKPIGIILQELSEKLIELSEQAGTPIYPIVFYNGIFFVCEGNTELHGDDDGGFKTRTIGRNIQDFNSKGDLYRFMKDWILRGDF